MSTSANDPHAPSTGTGMTGEEAERHDPFDPIGLEIMWQRVISIVEECWTTVWKTSFSVVVGEALDFGCEALDVEGNVLAHAKRSMPAFNNALPTCARACFEQYPVATLKPGDVLITNDPWLCAGHLFDVAVITPVFNREDEVVAFMGSVANVADIGGTRARHATREIYEEGLFIPPMKLFDGGVINRDLIRLIEHNVRLAPMVVGDIHAMVAANRLGAERLLAFMDEYALDDLRRLTAEVQGRTERAIREAIAALPDGTYRASQWCDGIDAPFELPVAITIAGDSLEVDFDGAPPQLPAGGTNVTLSILRAETVYLLKCLLSPDVPSNAGDFRPITVTAPEGSVLNCRHPASVNNRTRTLWCVPPLLMRALADVVPTRVQAFTGFPLSLKVYGVDDRGRPFNDHLFQAGGQGGSLHGDGSGVVLFPTSAGNVAIETFEARTPFLVDEKSLIPDSGGPGRHRGAPGQRVTVRRLPESEGGTYLLGAWPTGMRSDTPGLRGGHAGSRMRLWTDSGRGTDVTEHDGGVFFDMDGAQRVTVELPGGGGYGPPAERPRAEVQRDLDEGYVTPDGASSFVEVER